MSNWFRGLLAVTVLVLISMLCGCGGGGNSLDVDSMSRETTGRMPFGDIHELHSGKAGCLDCHDVHGMMIGDPTREFCLVCHTDKENHHGGQDCMKCHNSSGGPGNWR